MKFPKASDCRSRRAAGALVALAALLLLAVAMAAPAAAAKKEKKEKKASPNAIVAGTVTDTAGATLAGVRVRLTSAENPEFELAGATDKSGAFSLTLRDAEGGAYLLRFEKEGYGPFAAPLTVTPGQQTNVQVRLVDAAISRKQDAVAAFNEGAKALDAADRKLAVEKFRAALALDPDLVPAHLALADALVGEASYPEAAAEVEAFLASKPGDGRGLELAYEVYRRLGDREKERRTLAQLAGTEQAIKVAPRIYNEGVAAVQKGEETAAVELFRTALELDPKLVPAYGVLATLLYNAQSYDEAAATVAKLLEIAPDDPQGRRVRYLIHDARGEDAAAATALDAYLAVDPAGAAELLYRQAELDFRGGDTPRAQRALLKVLTIDPDQARAHYTLGLCYASGGDNAKAREHLRRFVELAPDDPEAADARQMITQLK